MPSLRSLVSSIFIGLAILRTGIAAPHATSRITKRQNSNTNAGAGADTNPASNKNGSEAILEPVVPPDVNQDDLSTLLLGTNITLAWAGSPSTSGTKRKLKRDDAVLSQATFTFKYSTVPLDHSNFVSNVACSGNRLTATLDDKAYAFAKSQWAGIKDLVFVTSVAGCGPDGANDFFHATAVVFTDSSKTFSATGSSAGPRDVTSYMDLSWGDIGTHRLKRAADKKEMFVPHPLHEREEYEIGIGMDWDVQAVYYRGADEDAPWDNAVKIAEISNDEGEEDDSWEKGEVADPNGHHKRSNTSSLALRQRDLRERELSYGMALYCVDCGFKGSAAVYGRLTTDWFDVVGLGVGFKMSLEAQLNLGLVAYVKYEKEWPWEIAHVNLAGWEIYDIISVGPFVDVSLVASAGISASGSLLIGAGVEWKDVDVYLDFLDPTTSSYAHNMVPTFSHTAEASGELSIEAKLELPVKVGLELKLLYIPFDDWAFNAEAAIVETPAIVAEGKFEVSAEVTDEGEIEYDINGGCYGIAWDIHFENDLGFEAKADFFGLGDGATWPLLSFESDPFAEGCIGYVDDGTHDDDNDPQGTGDSGGLGGNGLNSGGSGLAGSSNGNNQGSDTTGSGQVAKLAAISSSSSSVGFSSPAASSGTTSVAVASSSLSSTPAASSVGIASVAGSSSSSISSTTTGKTSSPASQALPQSAVAKTSSAVTLSTSSTTSSQSSTTKFSISTTSTSPSKGTATSVSVLPSSSKPISVTSSSRSSSTSSATTLSTSILATSGKSSSTPSTAVRISSTTLSTSTTSGVTIKPASTTTRASSSSTSIKPTCTPSQSAVASSPAPTGVTCNSVMKAAKVAANMNLSPSTIVSTADSCANECLKNTQCLSFSYSDAKSCQLYKKAIRNLGTTTGSNTPALTFYDRDCYAWNACSK